MPQTWITEELKTIQLGDQRLNERLGILLEAFADRPNLSIPAACGGRNELEAAYRFCDNDHVTHEQILQTHYDATRKRCVHQKVVVCAQDTTELDFSRPHQQVQGAGPLDASTRRGAFLHLNEAFAEDGTPLGAVWSKIWAREEPDENLTAEDKRKIRRALPLEEKESLRWLEGIRETKKLAEQCPDTLCVSVSDSESDIFELFIEPNPVTNFHWIVRAGQDRVVLDNAGHPEGFLSGSPTDWPILFSHEIPVREREQKVPCQTSPRKVSRDRRTAFVEVRAGTVTIRSPQQGKHKGSSVKVSAVFVQEPNPPQGDVAIEWVLLTTLPTSTEEEVRRIIEWYTVRWMIEIYFRTLKSGCRIEERRFETLKRMLTCTSIYLIVAWRTLFVCRLGRSCPNLPCDLIFEASEWQSVWTVSHRGEPLPSHPPSLSVLIRLVAILGGYVNRANRPDPPGVETLWKGLQRLRDLAWGWETFGPAAKR
jgi:hypothetical protein